MSFEQLRQGLMAEPLQPEELQQLRMLIDARLGVPTRVYIAPSGPIPAEADMLYRILARVMRSDLKTTIAPLTVLRESSPKTYRLVCDGADSLVSWLKNLTGRDPVVRVNLQWVYEQFVALAMSRLRETNVPVSMTTVCQRAPEFAGLFDRAFPDYAAAGKLPLDVIRPHKHNNGYTADSAKLAQATRERNENKTVQLTAEARNTVTASIARRARHIP